MVCWSCKHFRFQGGSRNYSEETPGYSAIMECAQGVWDFNFEDATQKDFEKTLKTAEMCDKFQDRR